MTKVTTNISFSQILFILLVFFVSALIFFYLGAKFGSRILNVSGDAVQDSILPDEHLSQEINEILKSKNHDFVFENVLQGQTSVKTEVKLEVKPEVKPAVKPEVKSEKRVVAAPKKASEIKKEVPPIAVKYEEPVVIDLSAEPKYRLQLGSFASKKDAEEAQLLWQKRGFDVGVVSTEVAGKGTWFRLNVGGYPDLETVKQAQVTVMSQYQENAKIIAVQ